jgi:3-deoxy-D-manno-octulosonic-acid transferase
MYSLYSFLFSIWVVVMTPYFLYNALRHKKYLPSMKQRLGDLPESLKFDGRPTIWIHACSVGETLSVQPVAKLLHERYPEARLVFSAITKGGYAIASERFAIYGEGNAFYFPIDLAWIAKRVLDWVRPSLLITIDTEIWPNVLREAKRRNVPIVMVNGRISAKSFRSYIKVQPLLAPVFRNYTALLMKAQEDAERIQRLGADPSKIRVIGNIKYDRGASEERVIAEKTRAIDESFGITRFNTPIIVAGSTHDDEEKTILDVFRRIRADERFASTRLILVPRHPERFTPVANLAQQEGFTVVRRSEGKPADPNAEVLLLDTIGELGTAFRFATVAFVGGTLIPHGGQSIMEPAAWARAILIGPSMKNFPGIIDDFKARNAVVQITATEADKALQKDQLTAEFLRLLADPALRDRMGTAAQSIFEESQGATERAIERIAEIYERNKVHGEPAIV